MPTIAARFFGSAILFAILGLVLGNVMAATHDHGQLVTHAHMMLIGWVSFALFGLFYHRFPERAASRGAALHFWLAELSFIVLVVGLYGIYGGAPELDPMAGVGSIAYLVSMVVFAVVAWPSLAKTQA